MDFYYHGTWRMDWGLGNPNKTAALIACLMIAVWMIAYLWKKGFWVALPIFTALGWCLVETYSRGGMLAALAGVAILLAWMPRPWPQARWIAVVASLWIVGLFILYAKAENRYSQGFFSEDQSINSRLTVWKHFPEMLAAAPAGWGWGNAGDSYTQWFQPPEQSVNYLNLVNSHFTWMAEGGWIFSVLYLFSWAGILLVCWPMTNSRLRALPLAVWLTFGVSACFSHVEESVWLWGLPLLLLGYVVWERFRLKQWPTLSSIGIAGILSLGIVAILITAGFAEMTLPIKVTDHAVALGKGAEINVISVDRDVMRKLYGHALRKYLVQNPDQLEKAAFIVTESCDYLAPSRVHDLIVSGRRVQDRNIAASLRGSDQVILINPGAFPDESAWEKELAARTSVYFGEYSQSPSRSSWTGFSGIKIFSINGAADFVPAWPQAILNASKI